MTREQRRRDYKQQAAVNLAKHEYTCLASQDNLVAWRCKAPGSTAYAFDIVMTRFGIAVVGDIDNLTFSVGLGGYGLPFLAGDDVTYYIHSKLDQHCKERRFSESAFRTVLVTSIARALADECDDELFDTLPEWLRDADAGNCSHWFEFRQLVAAKSRDASLLDDRWDSWDDLLREASDISHTAEAHIFMRDNADVLGLGEEWYEHTIDEPCTRLIQCLYMINHAANTIVAQAKPAAA